MTLQTTKKNKKTSRSSKNPNYSFLVSWQPGIDSVNRESEFSKNINGFKISASKRAEELAKEAEIARIRKDLRKSIILVSFILALEVMIYLARSKFGLG